MTASWLVADFAGDSSLLRGLDADGGSLMGFLPAPSQLGGVFGLENSWTLGLGRTAEGGVAPAAEPPGPASFRGLAARLEEREREQQEGGASQSRFVTEEQQSTGAPHDGPAWRAADPPVRPRSPRCCRFLHCKMCSISCVHAALTKALPIRAVGCNETCQ